MSHLFYPKEYKPNFTHKILPSGSHLLRFNSLYDIYYYDDPRHTKDLTSDALYISSSNPYFRDRLVLNNEKLELMNEVKKDLLKDKDFFSLIHKAVSHKRKNTLNKFSGNLSIVDFARQNEKMFYKKESLSKGKALNIALQVGTFLDEDYYESFKKILKLILSAQALNVSLNIDVFDSDTEAFGRNRERGYTIVNVAHSSRKLNLINIFAFSHREFFNHTLFNSYLAIGESSSIERFLSEPTIIEDLGNRYDIIGGNMVNKEKVTDQTISTIIKIANL